MRIQTEYMSFKNLWTISSSYDFQAHQQRSQRRCFSQTAILWFEVPPDLSLALPGLSPALPGVSSALPGPPRCTQGSRWHSEEFPNLSQWLSWYSCTSHRRSQLLRRPARMRSWGPILSHNWRIKVYTPHPLRYSWRLQVTKICFADEVSWTQLITHQCIN